MKQTRVQKSTAGMTLSHVLLLLLLFVVIVVPNTRTNVTGCIPMIFGIFFIEFIFLILCNHKQKNHKNTRGAADIISFLWILMIFWELETSVFNRAQPVLVPCPENVFAAFLSSRHVMLQNIAYSMQLLLTGFFTGLAAALVLGMIAGCVPRFCEFSVPIANVMAPIPAIVISPYLVSLLPSFRSASFAVIILGVFWPNFLMTVNRIRSMPIEITDSAKMMEPNTFTMITHIIFPYLVPGIVGGMKVSLTTSMLMLNFAELMGATRGMGFYVQNAIAYANYTQAVAGIFVIGIVVTVLNALITVLEKHLIRWH